MPGVKGRSGGQNRKSSSQHQIEGTFRGHRHSDRLDLALKPIESVKPPRGLKKRGLELWNKIVKALSGKCLTDAHLEALEEYCFAWELSCKLRPLMLKNPLDKETRIAWKTAVDNLDRLGRQFGWTPLASSGIKVAGGDSEQKSDLGLLLEKMRNSN